MSATATDARTAIDEERERMAEMNAGEGGRTIEDLAGDEPEQLQLIQIGGTKIDTVVGGSKPDESFVKIKSLERPIAGQLKRQETVTLVVTARVSEVVFVDKYDDDGRVSASKRRAVCTPVSITPLTAEQVEQIAGLTT